MKKQSAFTLIELMVVMAIIAILATAGLTAYSNYLKKARDNARLQTARQLMTKVEELANGGSVPDSSTLITFLKNENFAPVDSGTGLLKLDPLDGRSNCYGDESSDHSGGAWTYPCAFIYGKISDGSYFISYPVEHLDSRQNFWITFVSGNGVTSGNVIGTNEHIITDNYPSSGTESDYIDSVIFNNTNLYPSYPTVDIAELSPITPL